MAAYTLNILTPSVNNLTARIFMRAAGLKFEEVDVWGKTTTPEFLAKYPAHLTPMLEADGLPKGSLGESCAIMAYLCNKHGLDRFYPTDPGERAMVDSANFYLIGTLYPLVARATYPVLGFPQYPGEVATSDASDELKDQARRDARRPSKSRSTPTARSSWTGATSSGAGSRRSRTCASPPRSSSCGRSTTRSPTGRRRTWPGWRTRSARPTRSRRRMSAGSSHR